MKILGLLHHYFPMVGGNEADLHRKFKYLVQKGHKVEVICFMQGCALPFKTTNNMVIDDIKIAQKTFPADGKELMLRIKANDLVFTGLTLSPNVVQQCNKHHKPVANIVSDEICFSNPSIREGIRKSNLIISNSGYTYERLKLATGKESFIAFPSFNRETTDETYKDKEHILFFNPRKHKGYFIVKHLIKKFPNKKFVIVGDCSFDLQIGQAVDQLKLDNVEYLGDVKDDLLIDKLIKKAYVTLVPSLVPETFSCVAAESIFRHTPAIGSYYGALPQTIGKAGILVEKFEDPYEWANILESFFANYYRNMQSFNFEEQIKFYEEYSNLDKFEEFLIEGINVKI